MTGYTTVFFDLDDTLYPSHSGLWAAIGERIQTFIVERLDVTTEEASRLRRDYFHSYGTTLNGLRLHHDIDPMDFLAYVHDVPVNLVLKDDPELISLLDSLPQRKVVFTNADSAHARRVLDGLGISGQIDQIIDILALDFVNKPEPEAYRSALRLCGEADPQRCIHADDMARNLDPAADLGMTTVLVTGRDQAPDGRHRRIPTIHHLRRAVPELDMEPE
jgi:putative hydrolase of the HAD superfamily